ncbi:Nitrilase [compost metagenome]
MLGQLAKELEVYLIIGVVERDQEFSTGTLYNSMVYIGPDGTLLGKHRKLVPTGSERILWEQGDGSTLNVIDTPFGRIGRLISNCRLEKHRTITKKHFNSTIRSTCF